MNLFMCWVRIYFLLSQFEVVVWQGVLFVNDFVVGTCMVFMFIGIFSVSYF